jgi:hypothetical protein
MENKYISITDERTTVAVAKSEVILYRLYDTAERQAKTARPNIKRNVGN